MASNIAEDKQVQAQLKKKKRIVFVRCEAVIFDRSEVQKTCVYLAMAYLLVVRACFFAICIVKGLCSYSSTCLTKAGGVRQGCPCRIDASLALLLNSKDKTC